ncbi:hypothetical protein ES705_48166 [subsurface metagenome]
MTTSNSISGPPFSEAPNSVSKCGSGSVIGYSEDTQIAVTVPCTCKSWWCAKCKTPKALRLIERICSGDPERMITLTSNPNACDSPSDALSVMKAGCKLLFRHIRQIFGPFEYVLIWELSKRGWPHIHIAMRGSYISHHWLKYWWNAFTGAPIVHITKINNEKHASRYMAKYFTKDQGPVLRLLHHRRLYSVSRGWALRAVKSPAIWKASDFTWFRVPENQAAVCAEMKAHNHQQFDPDDPSGPIFFLVSPYDILPGTDGLTLQDLPLARAPPVNGPPDSPKVPETNKTNPFQANLWPRNDFIE